MRTRLNLMATKISSRSYRIRRHKSTPTARSTAPTLTLKRALAPPRAFCPTSRPARKNWVRWCPTRTPWPTS